MPVEIDPFPSDEALPSKADVVVIGGGIIGVTTALFLAERGIRTVLCEKGIVAGEQSSRNWGWCRTMGRDPRELPLAIESLRLWRSMNERIGAETGFRQIGTLYLESDTEEIRERIRSYGAIFPLVLVGALVVALLFSSWFQRAISRPILRLLDVEKRVSRDRDYALRAIRNGRENRRWA